jgi:hypothetical protein
VSGHAAAAPPSSEMNLRRFTRLPRQRGRAASAERRASDALLARAADCLDHAANLVLAADYLDHAAKLTPPSSRRQAPISKPLSDAHPDKRAHTEALSNAQ